MTPSGMNLRHSLNKRKSRTSVLMIITRSIGQYFLFTRFQIERDSLFAIVTRLGSGFTPPGEIKEARAIIKNMSSMLDDFEKIKDLPKDSPVVLPSLSIYQNKQQSELR